MDSQKRQSQWRTQQSSVPERDADSLSTIDQARFGPLNILRVATDVYPDITGGGAIHAHAMSTRQSEMGHNVVLLTSDHGGKAQSTVDDYTVVRHRELARPLGNSITPGVLESLRERLDWADVVHAHSHLYFTTNLASLVSRFSETPLVLTNHGLVSQTAPGWVQKLFLPTIGRFSFNSADRVLCYTDTDRRRLRERGVTSPISIVQNGIDCDRFTPGSRPARQELLFVGRLKDDKGVPTLLDVFADLAPAYPDLTLRIVGDGPGRKRYERQCVDHAIEDRVRFVGDVPYDEMPRQYRDCSIFVLPSLNEGLPRTVLEAMSCEIPVVTSDLEQLESIVSGAGYTVPKSSVPDFVDAISRLLDDDKKRARMGQRGRQKVLETNSWSQTVKETTAVYYDLVI